MQGMMATGAMRVWNARPTRPRKRGACSNCRLRKTRCDAIGSAVPSAPCTNCAAFSLPCSASTRQLEMLERSEPEYQPLQNSMIEGRTDSVLHPMQQLEEHFAHEVDRSDLFVHFLNPQLRNAPILEPGRVAYLGESSNFPLLVDDNPGVLHYQLPEISTDSRAKVANMDSIDISLLRQKGALSLPPWRMCDDLVESFFKGVAPALPIIDRSRFMRQYRDINNPPSLLLLQAIFLAGSTVSSDGATVASKQFYKRTKALYDSGYEDNRIIIVQSLLLISWYWEQIGNHAEEVHYWNGLATTVALGCGIHRSAERSSFSIMDRRLWKRIWWTLFIRDRATALLGQVVQIHSADADVEMVCEDDFIDPEYPPDSINVQFFLQNVKLCVLLDTILHTRDVAAPFPESESVVAAARFEMLLSEWLSSRPKGLRWEEARNNSSWPVSLQGMYQAALALLHRQRAQSLSVGDTGPARALLELDGEVIGMRQ